MGNRLPDGLGGCSHWVDMLGGVLSRGQSNRGGPMRDLQTRPGPSADLIWVDLLACDMQLFRVGVRKDRSDRSTGGRYSQQFWVDPSDDNSRFVGNPSLGITSGLPVQNTGSCSGKEESFIIRLRYRQPEV
jgi:hypothetical protein